MFLSKHMLKILTLSIAVGSLSTPLAASDRHSWIDPVIDREIRLVLTSQGYDVRKIERDDGLFEVYVLKGQQRMVLYLDDTRQVVRVKSKR